MTFLKPEFPTRNMFRYVSGSKQFLTKMYAPNCNGGENPLQRTLSPHPLARCILAPWHF